MNVHYKSFTTRITPACLQIAADHLSFSELSALRQVSKDVFLTLTDDQIATHPGAFTHLSPIILSHRTVCAILTSISFNVPYGSNFRGWCPMRYASTDVTLIASGQQDHLHIIKKKRHVKLLRDVTWIGLTSRCAYVWSNVQKQIIPIALDSGETEPPLELQIHTEAFEKLNNDQRQRFQEDVCKIFNQYTHFFLQEDLQLYAVKPHMMQTAYFFRLEDRKVVLLQTTDLSFSPGLRLGCSRGTKASVGEFVIYLGDEYALTCNNGIVKEKIHRQKAKLIKEAPQNALFMVYTSKKVRYIAAYSLTMKGQKNHWDKKLEDFPPLQAEKGKSNGKKVKVEYSRHILEDEQFVAVSSCRYTDENKPINLEVFNKRTGKRVFTKLSLPMLDVYSYCLQAGKLSVVNKKNEIFCWDLIAKVSLGKFKNAIPPNGSLTPCGVIFLSQREIQVLSTHIDRSGPVAALSFFSCDRFTPPLKPVLSSSSQNNNNSNSSNKHPRLLQPKDLK